jgi:hypothetical protein
LAALTSSSTNNVEAPDSIASIILAACDVDPLASFIVNDLSVFDDVVPLLLLLLLLLLRRRRLLAACRYQVGVN